MRWTSVEDLPIDLQGTARQVVADMARRFPGLDVAKVEGVVVAAVELVSEQADDDRPLARHVEDMAATVLSELTGDGGKPDVHEEREQ
jgi:hypothetical protein